MKTKTRKTTRILCASTIAAMTILGSAAPALTTVMATNGDTATTSPNYTVSFDKKIYVDTGENAPDATVTYTVKSRTPGSDEIDALKKSGFDNVEAGTADLSASDSIFTKGMTKANDGDYYVSPSTIDAEDLVKATKKPTVYTYTITENAPSYLSAKDKDGDTRNLEIFVGYKDPTAQESGTLSVLSSVLYKGKTYSISENKVTAKVTGFENDYNTNSDKKKKFTVTKKVTGNQGDKTKGFTFTVHISNQYSKVTASGTTTSLVESKLTPDSHHEVNFTVDLANDETLELTGVTKGATYTVTEDKAGYTQTATVDGTEVTADENTNTLKAAGDVKNDDDNKVVFTNNKEGTIPTGIYLNHKLPFNILGVALAGGAVALIAKKRHEALEDEDDE